MFAAALLFIVLGSVVVVDHLHHRADVQQRALAVAVELESDADDLRVAGAALVDGAPVVAAGAEIDDELAEVRTIISELRSLGNDAVVTAVEQDLRPVDAAMRDQLGLVRAGAEEEARVVAEERTTAALRVFDGRVESTVEFYEGAAGRASEVSDVGLWAALLIAGAAIGGLSWRHERVRRASQTALEQRLQERVAEVAEITERHRQLEALKYSFVSAVSHELRTPLTAIHGSLEMLDDGEVGDLSPEAAWVVSVAARGTRRLSRLVEDIIDLERLESGSFGFYPASHALHALLDDARESMIPLSERAGVGLVLHETHADVRCDGDRVQQALINLIGNAIKFTPPGGSIHLEAVRRGDEVEVAVRDEGRGIPAEQLDAVFERFHQVDTEADQARGGAGLGLTITRHIIEAQGGRIWVESEVGAGTAFRFTLPLAREVPREADLPA